jgi:hypothetical protein
MKLIEYNSQQRQSDNRAEVQFSIKGVIRFNRLATKTLDLTAGCFVTFYQDAERPTDWYVKKTPHGAKVRADYSNNGSMLCNFSEVTRNVLTQLKRDSARVRLATQPGIDDLYAILTKSI